MLRLYLHKMVPCVKTCMLISCNYDVDISSKLKEDGQFEILISKVVPYVNLLISRNKHN